MASLRLSTHARRYFRRLYRADRRLFDRLDRSLDRLCEQPELGKPLAGPLEGHRSLRVGHLRIVYRIEIDAAEVCVLDIAPRGGVYRDLP